ncbi:MAG: glycoside hydrolase 43 family protein, partial [Bacteroidales bacterium]|nr:glycoside hydrolase 43 family protein [Bacteroidales bacterium]
VIRVGDDYYMTASSFNCVPGLPVLHSKDLVNWELTGYALSGLYPQEEFRKPVHGGGVWAPCIRFHNNEFYIYYPDPDRGIFLVRAKDPAGPWSDPLLVKKGKGLIDPAPLWDDDGRAYMIYAFAGSRAGIKSILVVSSMNAEGTKVSDSAVLVFDGHDRHPTVEGPKFYKRNGLYYIFAPAGGVTNGWQLALRADNVYGPYEAKTILHQGNTNINGPHQGAWVTTQTGEDWFIHFQDKDAYGRIVHLQPMKWKDDWPEIGIDQNGDGIGEPVSTFLKPDIGDKYPTVTPPESDEFSEPRMGLQWQWHANPSVAWGFTGGKQGFYRLNCIPKPEKFTSLWDIPNLLLQKLPAETFTATTALTFNARNNGEEAGLVVMGTDYQYISLKHAEGKMILRVARCIEADRGSKEEQLFSADVQGPGIVLRVSVEDGAVCHFSYSSEGGEFINAGESFSARPGKWIGAKIGYFALGEGVTNDAGSADID